MLSGGRIGNGTLLLVVLILGATGLFWQAHAHPGMSCLTAIAMPMVLTGLGDGFALGPMTVSGMAGVQARDTGAVDLSLLVVVFAQSGNASLTAWA